MSKNRLSDTQAYSLSQNISEFIEKVTKEIIVSCMHIPHLKNPTEDKNWTKSIWHLQYYFHLLTGGIKKT